MLENKQKISKITLWKRIHCYCPLGDDWYTNELKIEFESVNEYPDYVLIDKELDSKLEKQDYIIEDVVNICYNIVKDFCPSALNIHITSHIDDAKHLEVQVEKY